MKTEATITSSYEMVTPEKARQWLDTSVGNRPISAKKVNLFATSMARGEWNRDAQPIYFDENGRLMDGHTRLNAVVKSGTTIEVNVKRGFPRAEWNKLNMGSIWTVGEFFAANGVKHPKDTARAIKIREELARGLRIGSISHMSNGRAQEQVLITDDTMQLYRDEQPHWDEDVDFAFSIHQEWKGIPTSLCAGVLHHLVYDLMWPRDFVCRFFEQVYTLEGISGNASTLRNRIDDDKKCLKARFANKLCLYICSAFEGYTSNVTKTKLQVRNEKAIPKFPKNNAERK